MAARKTTKKKAATKPSTEPEKTPRKKTPDKKKGGDVAPEGVNMGHVFALRPRVATAFPPDAFRRAKDDLAEERYASIEEAARAVAEKALETSQKKPNKHGMRR